MTTKNNDLVFSQFLWDLTLSPNAAPFRSIPLGMAREEKTQIDGIGMSVLKSDLEREREREGEKEREGGRERERERESWETRGWKTKGGK